MWEGLGMIDLRRMRLIDSAGRERPLEREGGDKCTPEIPGSGNKNGDWEQNDNPGQTNLGGKTIGAGIKYEARTSRGTQVRLAKQWN